MKEKEEILYATVHPAQMRGPKWMLDVAGHYARPDVFQLTVHSVKIIAKLLRTGLSFRSTLLFGFHTFSIQFINPAT